MFTRSTTGCYTCKARKKKCDEGRPKCQRCIRGGFECEGYALLSNPDSKGVMRRSMAPPPVSKSSHISTRLSRLAAPPHSGTSASAYPTGFQKASPIGELAVCITRDPSGDLQYDLSSSAGIDSKGPPVRSQDVQFHSSPSLWAESSVLTPSPIDSTANTPPTISHPILSKHTTSLSDPSFGNSNARMPSSGHPPLGVSRSYPSSIRPTNPPEFINTRQSTALFQAPVTLSEARTEIPVYSLCATTSQASYIRYGPALPSLNLGFKAKDEQDDVDDEDGPGAVTRALCRAVTPDPNTRDNALPFVLQSYARWVNFLMFDPLRVIHLIRDNIITQFSNSEESRTRVILMSNVLGSLGKSPELNPKGSSLAELLRTEVCQTMANYCFARSTSQYDIDIRGVLHTLGRVNEIILVQRFASPFSDLTELMQGAAPVFRQACLEPPGQPVSLPNVLLHPDLNVRSFATTDILISITKGCPMMFKYDVSHTPEMAEQMADGEFGLQWLHGIPDQALILLAQINVLYEDFGTSVDAQCISDLETQIRNIRSRPAGRSVDPFATVWRLVVHECWRQAVYVYLYMVLCGTRANDPRVLKAVRSFTRLANSVRPGRNPDAFLFLPMMVVGAAAYEPWDRDILRRRTLGLRECITPGTSGHECLLILVEIWERTTAENRPAVWHDLRLAALKIVGGA